MARGRRAGDRADGRLIRTISPFNKFIPFIMPTRNDAMNYYEESFEITKADKYIRELRQKGYKGIGMLHFLIAAYVRCVAKFPGINRFIAGRRIYAANDIVVVMTVKRAIELNADETTIKVHFLPTDTIFDVYKKMNAEIEKIKTDDSANGTEEFAASVAKLPRFIFRFVLWLLRVMDYFGAIPESLEEVSPFHGSMIITDLGSLRIGPIYHHIYNFGTLPVFISFGTKRRAYEIEGGTKIVEKKYLDTKLTLDERIADGHYYASFLQHFRYIFRNPEMLSQSPDTVAEDIF